MLYVGMVGWIGWLSWVIKKENDKITIITRTAGSNQTTELCQGAALPVPIFIVQIFISKVVTATGKCAFSVDIVRTTLLTGTWSETREIGT